ncbi:E3 ubiquitin-protein ligase UPL1 [Phytophthora cinnamomi]|uniref:E3 ubiquitin-protein ligase UPL1 n=1 Tax=Phytophthora cinnamomi TaxID=4785 RepID=UPI0035598763|nr:E3 ubiquitin-protein ligase UPL1 [Phytophthora cinnamomi]
MGKSAEHNATVDKEFASLEQVLIQTADDAATCLRLLKKNLSEYDSRHGNHFTNTAKSYMRSDIRNVKDISADLKHVAHQIKKSHKPSKSEVNSARNMMNATSKAMDVLKTTARNYDEKNGRSTGVKGAIKNAIGKNDNDPVDNLGGGVLGSPDTVEALVKATIKDNFNTNVLSNQITAAEKSLSSPSIVDRAKEVVHEVKDKLKGDKSSPIHNDHHAMNP